MSKLINYDFVVNTLITVEAPEGTDPDTLFRQAMTKLHHQSALGQIVFEFDQTFDAETGAYSAEWEAGVLE
jgi:hypothetical protein